MKRSAVYPCTYRELNPAQSQGGWDVGISLYLQGTHVDRWLALKSARYIPVPTGNSPATEPNIRPPAVYPCTYREL